MATAIHKTTLRSSELGCPSCVSRIEQVLDEIDGVARVDVRYASGRILIEHDAETAPVAALIDAVARAGYTANVSAFSCLRSPPALPTGPSAGS